MVGVLVRDHNGRQHFRCNARTRKARPGFRHGEAAIDEYARGACLNQQPVTFAAAAQGGKAHGCVRRVTLYGYLSSANSKLRMRSPAADLSTLPSLSCTRTSLVAPRSVTRMRYCSDCAFGSSLRQNASLDNQPFAFSFAALTSGSA